MNISHAVRAPGAEVAAAQSTAAPAWAARRSTPLLVVEHLVKEYPLPRRGLRRGGVVQAVAGVSFHVNPGETLGLVGESGCGKTTTARMVLRLEDPTVGSVWFAGTEMTRLRGRELLDYRKDVQVVLQDPDASLSPRLTVAQAVAEPLVIHRSFVFPEGRIEARPGRGRLSTVRLPDRYFGFGGRSTRHRRARVEHLLGLVGLDPALGGRHPHELSGGQRQRVGIARALALAPRLVVLDEPVSALDPPVQAGVVNLLADLQLQLGVAYLLIAHDLAVVRQLAHRVAVMFLGRIVETGTRADIFDRPAHPYTRALLSAVPLPDPTLERARHRIVLRGEPPSPADPPSGCRFRTRCWKATDVCAAEEPTLTDRGQGHPVACHFPEDASA